MDRTLHKDSPQVRIPPPLTFAVCMLIGWLIHRVWPAGFLPQGVARIAGTISLSAGIALLLHSAFFFKRFKTNILPWQRANALVKTGAYRFTRNPMYLSFLWIGIGVASFANNVWMLLMLAPFIFILQATAILKEERYLEEKFGKEYADYRTRVRRWL